MESKYVFCLVVVSIFYATKSTSDKNENMEKFRDFSVNAEDLSNALLDANKALNEANELNTKIKKELKEANETRRIQQETIEEMQQKLKSKIKLFGV